MTPARSARKRPRRRLDTDKLAGIGITLAIHVVILAPGADGGACVAFQGDAGIVGADHAGKDSRWWRTSRRCPRWWRPAPSRRRRRKSPFRPRRRRRSWRSRRWPSRCRRRRSPRRKRRQVKPATVISAACWPNSTASSNIPAPPARPSIEGVVMLHFVMDADGKVQSFEIAKSSGRPGVGRRSPGPDPARPAAAGPAGGFSHPHPGCGGADRILAAGQLSRSVTARTVLRPGSSCQGVHLRISPRPDCD